MNITREKFLLEDVNESGKSSMSGNKAAQGGGIYIDTDNTDQHSMINIAGEISNQADKQGSNVILKSGSLYLLSGSFKPQGEALTAEGGPIFNVYLDRKAGDNGRSYMDPASVSIESSSGETEEPNAVFLNNPDNFHDGSVTPLRTNLGGYTKDGLTDLVLVGQGIYLDGTNGDNDNTGLSPEDAVKDFATAKVRLDEKVTEANEDTDGEGFAPFIYICGEVTVRGPETWNLEHDKAPYKDSQYERYEIQEKRTPEPAQVKRFASFIDEPMVTIDGGTVTADKLIINGMKDAVVTSDQRDQSPVFDIQPEGELNLNSNAVVKDNYYNLIRMASGTLNLNGEGAPKDFNQLEIRSHGYGVYADGASKINMTNGARVYMENAKGNIYRTEEDYPDPNTKNLDNYYHGIVLKGSSSLTVDDSTILQENTEDAEKDPMGIGVVIGNYVAEASNKQTVLLTGEGRITGFNKGIAMLPYNIQITMKDNSSIDGNATGIYNSSDYERGSGTNKPAGDMQIDLTDHASIRENQYAIIISNNDSKSDYTRTDPKAFVKINMSKYAEIAGNTSYGIFFNTSRTYGEINMADNAKITNCEQYGIQLYDLSDDYDRRVTLSGHAEISYCDYGIRGSDFRAGSAADDAVNYIIMENDAKIINNDIAGISQSRDDMEITMTGRSEISGNGGSGVRLGYAVSSAESKLTMSGDSAIKNNGSYGLYYIPADDSGPTKATVELKGNAEISGYSKNDIYIEKDTGELRLKENAAVGDTDKQEKDSIVLNCPLYLEGTAVVHGMIYLKNRKMPIVMTKLAEGGQEGKYRLHLAEGFVGQNVVIPQSGDTRYPDQAGTVRVTDVSGQLSYFEKAAGEGIAEDEERILRAQEVNIVLSGENNVYLAGNGDDGNNGLTPETAVRTFRRAKELLEGDGHFESGANILISSGVQCPGASELDRPGCRSAGGDLPGSTEGQERIERLERSSRYSGAYFSGIPDHQSQQLWRESILKRIY